ncbi:putative mfs drug efflux protein [Botrytis fragariae]|uniref:Putative mfs drug efflux protein n=1 Tax=Botrytis fragariae TaxID=1964551 RepID=A0A8H6EFP0_9HELO|nr:putative mfs drug efflux protein [Botrytis fragariae]KAF5870644.1 putative mfs drug efflux protein [Botrytis fragariae]
MADPTSEKLTESSAASAMSLNRSIKRKHKSNNRECPPVRDITGWRWALVVAAILSSTFLFALDNTIVADVQADIVVTFNDVSKLSWLSVGFLIGAASTNLVWGKIYGQFNAKWTYIISIVIFEAGSALCGGAPNMPALIVGRALCGFGGSGTYVGVMTLLAASTTIHERPLYIGGTGMTWGLGTVIGPIIGGAFTDSSAGWRWAFYINLCIGAACAPVYLFLLPNYDPRPGVPLLHRAKEVDYLGGIIIIGAFVSGVMAVSFGGVTYPWNSGKIIGLFVCSGILFIIFGIQQVFTIFTTTSRRIFPIEFLQSRTMLILFAVTSAGGTAIFIPIYMIPIFFQFTRNDSALEAGVRLLPFIFLMIFAVISNGAILSAYGYYMPWYTAGGVLVLIGGSLMFADVTPIPLLPKSMASPSLSAVVAEELVSSAVGFITCAQVGGVTIALAIANSVFLNGSQEKIQAILPDLPAAEIQQQKEVIQAIVESMSKTYAMVITAGALTVVLSLLMKREKLFMSAAMGGA